MKEYSMNEARKILDGFRAGFPNIAEWMDRQKMVYVGSGCFVHPQTARDILRGDDLQQELTAFDLLRKPAPVDLTFMERVFKEVDKITGS